MSQADELAQQAEKQRAIANDTTVDPIDRHTAALQATMLNALARRAREAGR